MALTSASVRVLVAGDVGGKFETLNDRVKQVVAKSGNFHMLLCVGPFLESESSHESLAKFLESGQKAVIPTYFLGLKGESASAVSSLLDGHPDANLKYLGMHGVTKLEDLNIAYFDDLAVESLSTSPASELQTMCERATTLEGEVDLLLTCRWPDQILPPNSDPNLLASVAGRLSPACRKLACAFRPRYHVASCENKVSFLLSLASIRSNPREPPLTDSDCRSDPNALPSPLSVLHEAALRQSRFGCWFARDSLHRVGRGGKSHWREVPPRLGSRAFWRHVPPSLPQAAPQHHPLSLL